MYLHVFSETGWMSVGLVAAPDLAVVGFVGRVDVTVFLAIAGVGEATVAAIKLAFKRLLT